MGRDKPALWTKDFVVIIVINLFLFLAFQMMLPALPLFAKSLNGSDVALGWIAGSTTVASLIVRPFAGVVIDKTGRKGILGAGALVIIAVTLAFAWLPSAGAIIAVRFAHGIGWGMAGTASSTIASDHIPKSRFGEGMGYFALSNGLAMALAPGAALALFSAYGFTPVSILSAGFTCAALPLMFFVKRTRKEAARKVSFKGPLYERASLFPSVIMFFVCASYGSITGFLPLYAAAAGITNTGMFFTVYAAALLLSRPLSGKLSDRFGFGVIMYPALAALALALVLLSGAASLPRFLACAALYGAGFGSAQSGLQAPAITRARRERRGAANATFYTGFDGGIGFGAVAGGVTASVAGYGRMYLCFSLFIVAAAVLYRRFQTAR